MLATHQPAEVCLMGLIPDIEQECWVAHQHHLPSHLPHVPGSSTAPGADNMLAIWTLW